MVVPTEAIVAELRSDMLGLLERLDQMGLPRAGAHLAMAISCLDPESTDCDLPNGSAPPDERTAASKIE
jgi:hypothetical protein